MTKGNIELIINSINKYIHIANSPNSKNNIILKNNEISLVENSILVKKRKLNPSEIFLTLDKVYYPKYNPFNSSDVDYSPIEADYSKYAINWKNSYNKIDFPKFISIILFSLLEIGSIPDLEEFCQIYMLTYMEVIPKGYVPIRYSLYKQNDVKDRVNIGKELLFGFKNKEIRFKEEYKKYIHVPVNEFTTEQICSRIYKIYGSIVRDIYSVILLSSCGVNANYEFCSDLRGADMFIECIPVRTYVKTNSGKEFANKKENNRHTDVDFSKFVSIYVERPSTAGLKLMPITLAQDIAKNGIKPGSILEY